MMDGIDQFATFALAGYDNIATRVDYRTCDQCGFRLMRVEITTINEQQLVVARCPICEQFEQDKPGQAGIVDKKLQYFDAWLATHGLTRDKLQEQYHLEADHFFDDGD